MLSHLTQFSNKGNEVAFGTIGDSSTSEGHFWETMNAAGVMQVPIVMSVWMMATAFPYRAASKLSKTASLRASVALKQTHPEGVLKYLL